MQGNHQMLTSSGDQSIALWNTMYATQLGAFMGHGGTVRSLAICPTQEDVFASTSRDGSICIWDTRTAAVSVLGDSVPNYRPVATMRVRCSHQLPDRVASLRGHPGVRG